MKMGTSFETFKNKGKFIYSTVLKSTDKQTHNYHHLESLYHALQIQLAKLN